MSEKRTKRAILWGAGLLAAAGLALLFWRAQRGPETEPGARPIPPAASAEPADAEPLPEDTDEITPLLVKRSMEKLQGQARTDEALAQELERGGYTLEAPFVQLDPYHIAPLSAMALFQTDEETRITVRIPGDTPNAEVRYTLQEYGTSHRVPICGLYPDRENRVEITAETRSGESRTAVAAVETEPLTEDLQRIVLRAKTFDAGAYQPGLNFSFSSLDEKPYRFAFDCDGAIRWYLTDEMDTFNVGSGAAYQTGSRGIFLPRGNPAQGTVLFEETDLLGRVLNVYYSPYGSHHDTVLTGRGTLLVNGSNDAHGGGAVNDFVYEIDLATGGITHTLDYKQVLERTRIFGLRYSDSDWMHLNTAVYCGDDIVASSNFQSLVLCTDWAGNIKWMLGDPTGYLEQYRAYLLTPLGADFEWPYNQHAAQILPDLDGDPGTVDLLLFDNGMSRFAADKELQGQIANGARVQPDSYSRMVHYRVNPADMTVEQIWQYGKEHPELYADKRGDANLLPNGNILGLFSIATNSTSCAHAVYQEVDRAGNTVWQCLGQSLAASNFYCEYKTERLEPLAENDGEPELGREPGVYIPEAILKQCGY